MEARLVALEQAVAGLPTKGDLAELRADIAEGRTDMHKAIADNHRWTHTALMGMASLFVVGLVGLLFTIWSANKPQPAQPTQVSQPPIIINVPAPAPPAASSAK